MSEPSMSRRSAIGRGLLPAMLAGCLILVVSDTRTRGLQGAVSPWPIFVAFALWVLASVNFLRERAGVSGTENLGLTACVGVTTGVVGFALLVETAGMLPAALLAGLVASPVNSLRKPFRALLVAIVVSAAVSLVFVVLLRQPVPLHPFR